MAQRSTRKLKRKGARAKSGRAAPSRQAKEKQAKTSPAGALWQRVQRRDTWPRSWWYPLRPQRPQKPASEAVQKNYEECVATVRRTMLGLLGFCAFVIVVTFGTPDSSLIASEAKVDLPFAESKIEFLGFLIAAPALLIVLTLYLHIFDTSRLERENAYKVSRVPSLFTLDRPLPAWLTYLIFFWLVPVVLAAITWKALARLWWGLPLLAVTIAATGALIWIQIRRRPADKRFLKNLPLWGVLAVLAVIAGFAAWDTFAPRAGLTALHYDIFRRGLNLFRANLSGKWLANADLRDADLRFANLEGTNLSAANLQGANLSGAQLAGANLTGANFRDAKNLRLARLQGADLRDANLQGQDLREFNFNGMNLTGVHLQNANLRGAKLQGADLLATELQGADLSWAELQGAVLRGANLLGTDLSFAKLLGADLVFSTLTGANLRRTELLGAKVFRADLQGADLSEAQLQGAILDEARLQGADLSEAGIWLALFPDGLWNQKPAPINVATLNISPLTADHKAKLKKQLGAEVKDGQVSRNLMNRLDPILRDEPPEWNDESKWLGYISEAEEPSLDEITEYLADLACEEAAIAKRLAERVESYNRGGRRPHAKPLAQELLKRSCAAEALTDEMKTKLEGIVAAPE